MPLNATLRVTEAPNPLSIDIDVADTASFLRILGACDAMMFCGFGGLPHLFSEEVLTASQRTAAAIAAALRHPNGHVVLSGCGTSGRLAHLTALVFNTYAAAAGVTGGPRFHYLIAGGDLALLLPQESAEDKPTCGRDDLVDWAAATRVNLDTDPVVVVGISCGLSATYVASMLHEAMSHPAATAVALGLNPVEAVSAVRVDGWDLCFYDVLRAMAASDKAVILNPVVGPEAIAGSSRMKGGSITKVLLECICAVGLHAATTGCDVTSTSLEAAFGTYEATVRAVYSAASLKALAPLVQAASSALTTEVPWPAPPSPSSSQPYVSPTGRGRVLYIGAGTAGLLGIVDASECTPTYGSLYNDVRGFVAGGWAALGNRDDLTTRAGALTVPMHVRGDKGDATRAAVPEAVAIDLPYFTAAVAPTLTPADLVVLVASGEALQADGSPSPALAEAAAVVQAAAAAGAKVAAVGASGVEGGAVGLLSALAGTPLSAAALLDVPLPLAHALPEPVAAMLAPLRALLAVKLSLNAATVGAHIARGTIYRNRMINLMLTNAKLFHRAVGIVADVTGAPRPLSQACLLRALYGDEGAAAAGESLTVAEHVHNASSKQRLVPVAISLALDATRGQGTLTAAAAHEALAKEPVIRKAILAALGGSAAAQ